MAKATVAGCDSRSGLLEALSVLEVRFHESSFYHPH